jgi:probable F420-dependent oxidoreductase
MRQPQFGVRIPAGGPLASPEAMARTATKAEELGFDALWVHDFIVWTKLQDRTHVSCGAVELVREDTEPLFYESLTNLAWLAGLTKTIKLGVAVLCIPYREPLLMAKQVANVDRLSDGRLILGIGPGGAKTGNNRDFEVLGIPRREKWDRTREYVGVMKEAWTKEEPTYAGTWTNFEPTEMSPKPVQRPHPPLWGCGRMERTLRVTAELCSGWIPAWIPPDEYPALIAKLHELADESGRGDVDWTVGNEIHGCVAPTRRQAVEEGRATLGVFTDGFGSNPSQDRIVGSSFLGAPEEVAAQLHRFIDAGVSDFELKFIYHSVDGLVAQMELFADKVLPELR